MAERRVFRDPAAVARAAAQTVAAAAARAIAGRGVFRIGLSGGRTPELLYRLLASPEFRDRVDWPRVHALFADERDAPPTEPESNYWWIRKLLLERVGVPPGSVHRMKADAVDLDQAARDYEPAVSEPIDLLVLGLGEDGHTASLFPGSPALDVEDAWVAWSPPGVLPPPVDRITLTYPVLNAARRVAFLVAGENKAAALRDVLEGHATRHIRPAAGIRPTNGTIAWFVDEGAAGR